METFSTMVPSRRMTTSSQLENVSQDMADVMVAIPWFLSSRHEIEQALRFAGCQRRRRLIKYDDLDLGGQRLSTFISCRSPWARLFSGVSTSISRPTSASSSRALSLMRRLLICGSQLTVFGKARSEMFSATVRSRTDFNS